LLLLLASIISFDKLKFYKIFFFINQVIDVDGKEFGFTWSRDDLCDIYEERQSGEDGDGLLVECGSAWRKLNVLRTLDESTKKHVKKRSEEAERLHKSRKYVFIIRLYLLYFVGTWYANFICFNCFIVQNLEDKLFGYATLPTIVIHGKIRGAFGQEYEFHD